MEALSRLQPASEKSQAFHAVAEETKAKWAAVYGGRSTSQHPLRPGDIYKEAAPTWIDALSKTASLASAQSPPRCDGQAKRDGSMGNFDRKPRPLRNGSGWRRSTNAPPTPPGSPTRPSLGAQKMPAFSAIKEGQVFLLPGQDDIGADSVLYRGGVPIHKPFNHPLVVTAIDWTRQIVRFRLCTSYTQKTHNCGLPTTLSHFSRSRIALCDSYNRAVQVHDSTRKLTVEPGSEKFSKATYINFSAGEYQIEYSYLQPWMTPNQQPITFDKESIQRIKNCMAS